MFWAYGNFSNLEQLSTKSFLRNGYQLNIWTYGEISNAPSGAKLRDAREILPESSFFSLPSGSCAPFSDLFRYAVLSNLGGLWVDTDVIALKPFEEPLPQPFLVAERQQIGNIKMFLKKIFLERSTIRISNNVIFNPLPSVGNIVDLAYLYSQRFPKEKITWGELGPELLSAIARIYPGHGFTIKKPSFANPIDCWNCPSMLLKPGVKLHKDAAFLHLYNEMWRRAAINKNASFPRHSLMSLLAEQYL
jgi:glycosyl transferase-like sugar-binding protein